MTKKILIVKLGAMGDVIHTTVIATAIKQAHPDWQVDFLTTEAYASIIIGHPHIDNVIFWDESKRKSCSYILKIAYNLFKERYNIIFNLTRAMRNSLIARLAFPNKIVGKMHFDTNWVEEFFLTAKTAIKDIELPSKLYLTKVFSDTEKVDEILANAPRPYFIFAPGGATDKNRQGRIWNINKWKELCEKINKKFGGTIFIIGSNAERENHHLLNENYIRITSGELKTIESSYLLSISDLMVSGDSGPAHVAAAHGIKTLTLVGSTTVDKIKPYGENGYSITSKNSCQGCWKKKCHLLKENEIYTPCMEAISVDEVYEKIVEIYNNSL